MLHDQDSIDDLSVDVVSVSVLSLRVMVLTLLFTLTASDQKNLKNTDLKCERMCEITVDLLCQLHGKYAWVLYDRFT